MKVLAIVGDGYEDLEAMGPIALLRRAEVEVDVFETVKGAKGKYGSMLLDMKDLDMVNTDEYGALFIPGGPHIQTIKHDERVKKIVQTFFDQGKLIGLICAAPTIMGEMGLLKGKNYTCFKKLNGDFQGNYLYQYVVKDENIVTGLSAAASVAFGLVLLEEVIGKADADKLKESIYYE